MAECARLCPNVPECAEVWGLNVRLSAVVEGAEIPHCKENTNVRTLHRVCYLGACSACGGNHGRDANTQTRKSNGSTRSVNVTSAVVARRNVGGAMMSR